jgi:16S rRNA G966 N2-methylase RsmD
MILSRGSDDPRQDAPAARVVVCSAEMDGKNKLYFGDNLNILRDHVADSSVDLIYLDPPFNSSATYNVLFKEKSGEESAAQITAFEDTIESRTRSRDNILLMQIRGKK